MPLWTFLEILSWASGTIFLLSTFSLLRIVLIPLHIPSKLKWHRPILSVCLSVCLAGISSFSGYILGKSQEQPWLYCYLYALDSQIEIKHFGVLSSRFIFFLLSNVHFHVDIICLFHGGYHAHLNILFIVFNGFLLLIIY